MTGLPADERTRLRAEADRVAAELASSGGGSDPFAAAVRATRMPMIVTNPRQPDNPVVFANAAFCRLTGYRPDEILGRNCRFLQGADSDPAVVARIRAAVAGRRAIETDIRNYRKDGQPFWNRLLLAPVRDTAGDVTYFFASQVDVTIERERLAGLETHNAALLAEVAGRMHAQRESEARLRFAAEAGRMGIWELDLRGGMFDASATFRDILGCACDTALTWAQLDELVHRDDRAARRQTLDAALAGGAQYDDEFRIMTQDGATSWVQVRAQVVRDADGTPLRLAGIALDVTATKRARIRQDFLVALWDRLRDLSDPDAIMDVALRALLRQLSANRVGYGQVQQDDKTIVLQSRQAAGVRPLAGTFPLVAFGDANISRQRQGLTVVRHDVGAGPGDSAVWAALDTRALVSVPLVREGRFRASLFATHAAPHVWRPDELALIEAVAGRLWDSLDRARAEVALREANNGLEKLVIERTGALRANEARLRTIFEASFQLQGLLAPDGTLREANATLLAAMNAAIADVASKKLWETPWFSGSAPLAAQVRAAVVAAAAGRNVREELGVPAPQGVRSYDFSLRPIGGADGAVAAIVLEAADITERRRAEEALRQAQKMEAIGQLTGGIAHDFNNLLTGITGSLELLNKRVAAGRMDDFARLTAAAMTSAQRAAALTQRLLAFARRQPLDPRRVEANRLVAGIEDLLRRTLGPATDLEMVLAASLWATLCDPNQLENAILNLAINARDAMPAGGRLTIETANRFLDDAYAHSQGGEVGPGQYVAVAVTDTGTGMPPDVVARAFDPFFTTKPTGQGTGLGLSMLYGFVKQSGGHVRIYSEMGSGTTITLFLPRLTGGEEEAAEAQAAPAIATLRAETGERVLVVDDEPAVRMLVIETLDELGYASVEAGDGPAALRILQSDARIDLLVTDVGLPGLNGRQLADAARVTRPDLRVLFVTGYAHNAAVGGGVLEPGMEIITKPFALDHLALKIRSIIERV